MLKAVLFDLDGTLIDTPGVIVETAQAVLRALGRGRPELAAVHPTERATNSSRRAGDYADRLPADPEAIRATIGLPLPLAFAQLLGGDPASAAVLDAVERYRVLWRAEVSPRIAQLVYPGALEGVRALHGRGLQLAVVTGKAQSGADATVDAAGLRPFFHFVGGYDLVPRPKPHPDLALLALERLGAAAEDAVVVGDAAIDVLMARAAGVRSIAVTYGAQSEKVLRSAGPTWVAHSVAEMFALLGGSALDGATALRPLPS